MLINIIIYILLALLIAIDLTAFVRHRQGKIVAHPNYEFISSMIRFSNLLIIINVGFTLISAIIKALELINFDVYMLLMFIGLSLITLSSVIGFISVIAEYINIRRKGKMPEFSENRSGRLRLLLQLLMFAFGITWLINDYMMMSFDWFDVFLRLITFTPLQEIPVPAITYFILLYLVAISPLYDMISLNFHRKKQ